MDQSILLSSSTGTYLIIITFTELSPLCQALTVGGGAERGKPSKAQ